MCDLIQTGGHLLWFWGFLIAISVWLRHWICWLIPTVLLRMSRWVWSLLGRLAICFLMIDLSFLPISQLIYFAFMSVCFIFLAMCSFQFSLQSKCSPRYCTDSTCGSTVWLMLIAGQLSFLRVKVTCDDLVSFTFIFHFFSQFSTVLRYSWRLREATMRSAWVANTGYAKKMYTHFNERKFYVV